MKVGEVQMAVWKNVRQHVFLLHFLILVAALRTSGEGALNRMAMENIVTQCHTQKRFEV